MSITGAPQVPNEMRFGIAQQAVLGTAVADSAAFTEIDCEPFEINYGYKQIDVVSSHGKRYQTDNDIITHANGLMPSFTITGIANNDYIDYMIYAYCQSVLEAATGTFQKTFVVHTSQPAFGGLTAITEEGQLLTVILRDPASSKSVKLADCIAKSLTLTWEHGEPLKYSCEFVSKNAPSFAANPTGTWTKVTSGDFFYSEDIDTVQIDSTDYHLNGFELALSRDILPVGQDGAGNFADYAISKNELGFKMKVVKDADFEALLTAWSTNAAIVMDVKIGDGTADGDFTIDARGKMNADTGVQKVYDELMHGEINGKLLEGTGPVAPLTLSMANTIDRTWPTA